MLSFFNANLQLVRYFLQLRFHFVHFPILTCGVIGAQLMHVFECTISDGLQKNVHVGQLQRKSNEKFTPAADCKRTIECENISEILT